MTSSQVAILDAGSQFGKVIDRRVRELNVESVLLPFNTPAQELKNFGAIILSGGPESVYGDAAPKYDPAMLELPIPILGICYGMQLLCHRANGTIEAQATREDGQFDIHVQQDAKLFAGFPETTSVLLTHGDSITSVGDGFRVTAKSDSGIIAACESLSDSKPAARIGVQFHPEVDLTERGQDMFRNFLFGVAGLEAGFTIKCRRETAKQLIRSEVGPENDVLVLVSGGVDSSVCAALLQEALPAERIFALHIDSGFMRKGESALVKTALEAIGLNLRVVDASRDFFDGTTDIRGTQTQRLVETVNPEHKRKIIGDTFMRVADKAIRDWGLDVNKVLLAQGTLRPDLIESASSLASTGGTAQVIKTHHNDTALVRQLRDQGRIVEPLKDYHKDEVRVLGRELGLPEALVERQPFPGPGLAIRILCAEEPYLTERDQESWAQLSAYQTDDIKMCLVPIRTVGVQGDGRSYAHCAGVSYASGQRPTKEQWQDLCELAKRVPRTTHGVNRVVFVFGEAVEGRLTSITPTHLTPDVIQQLQAADAIVSEILQAHSLVRSLSQVPVILFPCDFNEGQGKRSICIRTFITNDFMTGVPARPGTTMPLESLHEMVDRIQAECPGIARVCFDMTPKPPGTTEWE